MGYQIGEKLGSICMEREEDEEEKKQSPIALFKGSYAAAGAAVLEVELKGAIVHPRGTTHKKQRWRTLASVSGPLTCQPLPKKGKADRRSIAQVRYANRGTAPEKDPSGEPDRHFAHKSRSAEEGGTQDGS